MTRTATTAPDFTTENVTGLPSEKRARATATRVAARYATADFWTLHTATACIEADPVLGLRLRIEVTASDRIGAHVFASWSMPLDATRRRRVRFYGSYVPRYGKRPHRMSESELSWRSTSAAWKPEQEGAAQ